MEKNISCLVCEKKTYFNTKFRLRNFPFCFAYACKQCGDMLYY